MVKRSIVGMGRRGRRRGAALLEFALVLPVLVLVLLGIIDFGLLNRETLVVSNAAREGARAAALGETSSGVRDRIQNMAAPPLQPDSAGRFRNGTVTLEQATPSGPTGQTLAYGPWPPDVGEAPNRKNAVARGSYVRVTVLYNHRSITGLFNKAVSIPVVMRRED